LTLRFVRLRRTYRTRERRSNGARRLRVRRSFSTDGLEFVLGATDAEVPDFLFAAIVGNAEVPDFSLLII